MNLKIMQKNNRKFPDHQCHAFRNKTLKIKSIGVPDWVVDLRHRAAHNHLPPLDMFKRACDCLRELIWEKYWSRSIEDAMKWAVPRKVFEDERAKSKIHRHKERACDLISNYVRWKNENPTKIASKLEFSKIPVLVEIDKFIKESADTMIAFLSYDVLILTEEKVDHMGFDKALTDGIWEIPIELQTYWADIIALIHSNQKLMSLLLACLKCMYESNITTFQRKQLSGWVDLLLDMLLIALKKGGQISSNETGQWRKIVKCILNADEDFKPSRAIEIFETTKIFNEKKTSQLVRLTKLRARDLKIAKTISSNTSDDTVNKSLSTSAKNLSFFGNDMNTSVSILIDSNKGKEWCIADVDFSDVPLGLMPDQSSESLYLLIDD
uniref:Uncharacterized protein n=1 Tax=Panagrolaimus davidi TaxID=227884 RepID=A0A914QWS6_9BILA